MGMAGGPSKEDEAAFRDLGELSEFLKQEPRQSPAPQPVQGQPMAVPQLQIVRKRHRLIPFRTEDGTYREELVVARVVPTESGVKVLQDTILTNTYASDGGTVNSAADVRRSIYSGLTYTVKNMGHCANCGVEAYKPEMEPSKVAPAQRLCRKCAKLDA